MSTHDYHYQTEESVVWSSASNGLPSGNQSDHPDRRASAEGFLLFGLLNWWQVVIAIALTVLLLSLFIFCCCGSFCCTNSNSKNNPKDSNSTRRNNKSNKSRKTLKKKSGKYKSTLCKAPQKTPNKNQVFKISEQIFFKVLK